MERDLNMSYGRANKLISQLIEIDVLEPVPVATNYRRRFRAPAVQAALLRNEPDGPVDALDHPAVLF